MVRATNVIVILSRGVTAKATACGIADFGAAALVDGHGLAVVLEQKHLPAAGRRESAAAAFDHGFIGKQGTGVQSLPSASHATLPAVATSAHWPDFLSQTLTAHGPSFAEGHWTIVLGFNAHFAFAKSQNSIPLHASPSSNLPQSVSALQLQVSSPAVAVLHCPVAGSQVVASHCPSLAVLHTTMVFGLILHLYGGADVSQTSVPLQRLPSSMLLQSLSAAQAQMLPPDTHLPAVQLSPCVHGLPSSHPPMPSALCTHPLVGLQLSVVHGLPSLHPPFASA